MAAKKSKGSAGKERPTLGQKPKRGRPPKADKPAAEAPKKRGRPPKADKPAAEAPKKRGRPPKAKSGGPTAWAMRQSVGRGKKAQPGMTQEQMAGVPPELHEAANNGDQSAQEQVKRIVKAYELWCQALARRSEVSQEIKQSNEQEKAAFTAAVEQPVKVGADDSAFKKKCESLERKWADWQEAIMANKEAAKAATKAVKEAKKLLADAVENSSQLALPFPEKTQELPGPVAEAVRGGNATENDDPPACPNCGAEFGLKRVNGIETWQATCECANGAAEDPEDADDDLEDEEESDDSEGEEEEEVDEEDSDELDFE